MIQSMKLRVGIILFAGWSAGCSSTPTQPLGERTFNTHCAACHGPLGEGDGPTAATLSVTVPNLRSLSQRNGGEFPTDAVASYIDGRSFPAAHGTREMPVWGPVFSATQRLVTGAESPQQRIEDVIAYLRELQY
jgi:mono/diheme cytochrome c family protein